MPTSRVILIYGLTAVAVLFLVIPAAASGSLGSLAWSLVPAGLVALLVLQGARLEPRRGLPLAALGTLLVEVAAGVISGDPWGESLPRGVIFAVYAAAGTFAFGRMARSQKR